MQPTAGSRLNKLAANFKAPEDMSPLWKGPQDEGPMGGVTQSMLGRFLSCRERFRVSTILGLKPKDDFKPQIEYGNLWHACEEALANYKGGGTHSVTKKILPELWEPELKLYASKLYAKYPMDRQSVEHWYNLCKTFFPLYVKHWSEHPDVKSREPVFQEQVFHEPYTLPSGRTVYLRGKYDAVDIVGSGNGAAYYLQENKTKSTIDGGKITRQLKFDLQTMLYLITLKAYHSRMGWAKNGPVGGVRYNVIRRPAHKSVDSALKKFNEDVADGRIEEWFARYRVEVSDADIKKFRLTCLEPVLEQLCDWYQWVTSGNCWRMETRPDYSPGSGFGDWDKDNVKVPNSVHFRFPFGIYNPISEGGFSDVDAYLESGSTVGLKRAETLFPELQ